MDVDTPSAVARYRHLTRYDHLLFINYINRQAVQLQVLSIRQGWCIALHASLGKSWKKPVGRLVFYFPPSSLLLSQNRSVGRYKRSNRAKNSAILSDIIKKKVKRRSESLVVQLADPLKSCHIIQAATTLAVEFPVNEISEQHVGQCQTAKTQGESVNESRDSWITNVNLIRFAKCCFAILIEASYLFAPRAAWLSRFRFPLNLIC